MSAPAVCTASTAAAARVLPGAVLQPHPLTTPSPYGHANFEAVAPRRFPLSVFGLPERGLERTLVGAALVLVGLQTLLLVALWQQPLAPAELPEQELPKRERAPGDDPPPTGGDRIAVEVLDRLLAQRLAAAVARTGRAVSGPSAATRAAAVANPDPAGPAVAALIADYAEALAALGETLDATSTPGSGASPETPGPAAELK